jgi:hypothetical protein
MKASNYSFLAYDATPKGNIERSLDKNTISTARASWAKFLYGFASSSAFLRVLCVSAVYFLAPVH